jgi:outer membrane beta-barrel protein
MSKQLLIGILSAVIFSIGLSFAPKMAQAQDDFENIESLFSKDDPSVAPTPQPSMPHPAVPEPGEPESADSSTGPAKDSFKGISDLSKLDPFSDVAVIQRRFLPKTGRFEAFGGATVVMNDAFFLNYGLNGRLAYYFRERYGVEFVGSLLTNTTRQVTDDLRNKRNVITTAFVTPTNYFGLDFKWVPVYGKMSWRNHKIVPFDLYFSLGLGSTTTNQGGSAPTLHLGTGQVFAKTKGMAFRWDFSWNMFNTTSSTGGGSALYNNLFLSLGMSFFFPEATYR